MCKTFVLFYKEVWTVLHIVRTDFLEKVMSLKFGYKALSLAVFSTLTATAAQAAGLDRSGQDVTAFLQDGTYAETVYTYIDANVTGKDTSGKDTGDIAEAYDFFRMALKQTSTTPLVWVYCTMSHLVQQLSMMVIAILWQIKMQQQRFLPKPSIRLQKHN